jgi:hypothetical protein
MLATARRRVLTGCRRMAARGTLACLVAPDGQVQPPSRLVLVEDFRSEIQRDLANDLGHGFEISRASSNSMPSRPAMKTAGPPLSSGGQALLPLMQAGYAFPTSDYRRSSMRISWRHGTSRSYSSTNRAPLRNCSAARVASGKDADSSHEP